MVRKGIEKLKNRNGDISGSENESDEEALEDEPAGRKGKGRPTEVVTEINREDQIKQTAEPVKAVQADRGVTTKPKKSKSKGKGKKVSSWMRLRPELMCSLLGTRTCLERSQNPIPILTLIRQIRPTTARTMSLCNPRRLLNM